MRWLHWQNQDLMSSWHIKDLLALLLWGSIVPDLSMSQGNKNPCTYTNIFHKKLGLILSSIGCIFVNKKPLWSECNHGEYTHKNTAPVTKQELQEEISIGVCKWFVIRSNTLILLLLLLLPLLPLPHTHTMF